MITLLGHGYIGQAICQELQQQGISYMWRSHKDDIAKETTVIINAAGYTGSPNVDACEQHKQETINGNVIFPVKLECDNTYIPIVHISSGCVYTGYKDGGWTEEDSPNFDFNTGSFYSGSKALGQEMLMPYMNKSYLLRIRMPFGDQEHPKNFLTKMKRYDKLISYDNSLSYVPDVAAVAVHFATKLPKPGIYNVCNPGYSNARKIIEMMDIEKSWFTEEEFSKATVAPRSNCILNTDKLNSVFPIQSAEKALIQAIEKMKG